MDSYQTISWNKSQSFLDSAKKRKKKKIEYLKKIRLLSITKLQVLRKKRDKRDKNRRVAPLQAASDAVSINTTELNAIEVFEKVLTLVRQRLLDLEVAVVS